MNKLLIATIMTLGFAQAFALLPQHEGELRRLRESISQMEQECTRMQEKIGHKKSELATAESRAEVAFAESQKAPTEPAAGEAPMAMETE